MLLLQQSSIRGFSVTKTTLVILNFKETEFEYIISKHRRLSKVILPDVCMARSVQII